MWAISEPRLRTYLLPRELFVLHDAVAGYFVSSATLLPIASY